LGCSADVIQGGPGNADEVVLDAQQHFAHDEEIVSEHEVKMLGDGAGQGILNWNDGRIDVSSRQGAEDI
jgi:hypothetical protein